MRADNADQRLTPVGLALGCVGEARRAAFDDKMAAIADARARLEALEVTPRQIAGEGVRINADGGRRNGIEALALPEVNFDTLVRLAPDLADISPEVRAQVARDALYCPLHLASGSRRGGAAP